MSDAAKDVRKLPYPARIGQLRRLRPSPPAKRRESCSAGTETVRKVGLTEAINLRRGSGGNISARSAGAGPPGTTGADPIWQARWCRARRFVARNDLAAGACLHRREVADVE
jgi:hypothetical protein